MKHMKSLVFGAGLALTAMTTTAPTAVLAQELRIAMPSVLSSLDPHNDTSNATPSVASGVMQRLIGFDPDLKPIPMLAESWEASEDATVFTLKLRQGVMYHDGTPFNAEAAKVNIDRLANQDNNLRRNSMLRMVDNTEALDEYTLQITLKEPFGALLATLAHPSIVMHSPAALEKYGDDIGKHMVGTGPFRFVEWVPGEHVIVEKFDDYWEPDLPKVDRVTVFPVPESATRVSMLRSDEVQYVATLPAELFDSVKEVSEYEVLEIPGISVWTAAMNMMREEFKDPRVRLAFNLAIDKEAFMQVVYSGHGVIPTSPIAPNTAFYSAQEPYPYDLERARELMKEAGYEDGFALEAWGRNNTAETRMLQFLKQQLSQINVDVTIFPMEPALRSEKVFSTASPETSTHGLLIGGWSPSTGDADWHLRPVYATESWIPKIYNMGFYSNPEVDGAIEQALKSADPEVRGTAYAEAQKLIWDDVPVIWFGSENKLAGMRADLTGVYPMPDGTWTYLQAEFE